MPRGSGMMTTASVANDDRPCHQGQPEHSGGRQRTFNVKSNQDTTVNGNQSNMVDGDRTEHWR